jgi:cation-transporting ATPase 13A3/4/5
MGSAYSYPDGPEICEGVESPCPRIDGPGHGSLVFLYLLWGGTLILYIVYYVLEKKPAAKSADGLGKNKGLLTGQQQSDAVESTLQRNSAYHIEEPAAAIAAASSSPSSPTSEKNKADQLYKALLEADEKPVAESLIYVPYRKTLFGTVCYYWMHIMTAHWVMLFIIIMFDVYFGCQVRSVDSLCAFGSYPIFGSFETNEPYFFTYWCLSMSWFVGLFLLRDLIPTFFMQTCSMRDAEYMYVWAKDVLEMNSSEEEAAARSCEYTDTEPYQIVKWVRALRARFTPQRLREGHESTVLVQRNADGVPFFVHEATRYVYNDASHAFGVPVVGMTFAEVLSSKESGLSSALANKKLATIGENKIPFECDTMLGLAKKEFLSFFYLYQLAMYMVWFWQSYLFVASIEACLVFSSAIVSIYIQWTNQNTISQITKYETPVSVKRDNTFVTISSDLLVPGDLVLIDRSHWIVPCDLVLVKGSLVMNESGLTGESMPVLKTACKSAEEFHDSHMVVKHTIYAGTSVLQVNADESSAVLGVVTATGTFTSKGQLISSILYPEVLKFRYEEELEAVILMLLGYGIIAFIVSLILQSANGGSSSFVTKWAYGMFTASQIFSPLLPVALKVGQIRSSKRLSLRGVFCVNPRRIAISGKVNIFCFDKTGTITKDGMEFSGVSYVEDSAGSATLSPLYDGDITAPSSPVPSVVVQCLATCHSLAIFGNEFVGNDVEVKMFTATKWTLRNVVNSEKSEVCSPGGTHQMLVHRKWEFDHGRQTMTVMAENIKTKSFHIFCKGSFEKIANLCDPKTVPASYHSVARRFAMNGGYVLGLAHRAPASAYSSMEVISRDEIETPGTFHLIGLLIFRNEPKQDSRDAIMHLREGVVRPVMITGDNAQCGQYIARKCSLVDEDAIIMLGELDSATHTVHWSSMTLSDAEVPITMTTAEVMEEIKQREQPGSSLRSRIEYAVTGNLALGILDTTGVLNRMLPHIKIFARMSPSSKAMAITRFRSLGFVVGMCGDGGNDCGALRAAHTGIALSEAEASVVSPFTSNTKSIQSVVDLLKEGIFIYML